MKKIVIILLIAVIVTSCKKDNHSENRIIIKGKISAKKNISEVSLSDAKKVLVIDIHLGTLKSRFIDIVDGSFNYSSPLGVVTALVFLNEQNNYIGTLSSKGLHLLPLCNLTEGDNTTIDLSELSLLGNTVIPTHDPLGNEIIITDSEINSLSHISGFFNTLAQNIDTDNDSILDVLNNKQLFLKTRFNFSGGQWGINDVAPAFSFGLQGYQIEIQGGMGFSLPNNVAFSGPPTAPYQNISLTCNNPDGNNGFYAVFGRENFLPFESGTYTISIDGNDHTLDYTFIDPAVNLVFIIPTLHTNSEGKLISISLEYKTSDGSTIDPINILSDVMVQFMDTTNRQFYDTPRLIDDKLTIEGCNCVKGLYSYSLETPLDISSLDNVLLVYNDLLGNSYAVRWTKENMIQQ